MNRNCYRFEPIALLSERGRKLAQGRVALAARRVRACERRVRQMDELAAREQGRAAAAVRESRADALAVRAAIDATVDAMISAARDHRADAAGARVALDRSIAECERRRSEARVAVSDAELHRSARERAMALSRARARRKCESRSAEDACAAWAAARRDLDQEDDRAS